MPVHSARRMGLPYAGSASDWMYAYPGVPERLAQLQQEGFMIVIMNNQAGRGCWVLGAG